MGLNFPTLCLRVPTRSSDKRTLTTKVKNQILEETDPVWAPTRRKKCTSYENDENVFMKGLGKKCLLSKKKVTSEGLSDLPAPMTN